MKTISWKTLVYIVCALGSLSWAVPATCGAQVAGAPQGVVGAIQGSVAMTTDQDEGPTNLVSGGAVNAWNMVSTDEASKLLLNWNTGIISSLGPFTSVFMASQETDRGPLDSLEMTEGILRVANPTEGRQIPPYMVATPVAQVEPVNHDDPVDFIVEVHDPATTAVTVISGQVKVRNTTLKQPTETIVSACQNVYVDKGKSALDLAQLTSEDLTRLVEASTIPDSMALALACPTPTVQLPPPPPSHAYVPQYEYEDWGSYDMYPYEEITFFPPRPGVGCIVVLPGIGRWIIPMDVFVGWRYDPAVMGIYCRHIILDHMMHSDRYYLADIRLRRRQLHHMAYLAQLSGNTSLLLESQRKLADLNVRSQWASKRLKRLEGQVSAIEREQQKFAHKLPKGKGVFKGIANSFNSPRNLAVARDFRNRINTQLTVQSQLANLAGKELKDLRSRIAREQNPRQRMALREQFAKINRDVAQGKIPIPAKEAQLKRMVERLTRERDPKKLQDLQNQFNRVAKIQTPHTAEVLSQAKLTSLKQDLAKYPNRQKRLDLEKQVSRLQRSVEDRTAAEKTVHNIDRISAEAAREKDPRKRSELLGQLDALAKPAVPPSGPAAGLHTLGQRQLLETQLSLEKDKRKREALTTTLEEQRKFQSDLIRQQKKRRHEAESAQRRHEEIRKQTQQKVPEHVLEKQKEHALPRQIDRLDLQKQQAEQSRKQREQTDSLRLQKQQTERARKEQQAEQLRRRQEQTEQLHKRKEQADRLRLQQEQSERAGQKQQAEQLRRQKEQAEKLHKQKEQTDRLRLQQEQSERARQKQQAEQLRRQKEQAEKLHKQKEQTDRLRLQQKQSERARQKQQAEQLGRQKEQAEKLHKQKEQTDRLRRQQEQSERARQIQQTEQLRRQKQQMEQQKHQQGQVERARRRQNPQQQEDETRRRLQPR